MISLVVTRSTSRSRRLCWTARLTVVGRLVAFVAGYRHIPPRHPAVLHGRGRSGAARLSVGMLLLIGALVARAEAIFTYSEFLENLVGHWHGEAVTTPIGPQPYTIEFQRQPDGDVAGVADTGGSLHHWEFIHRDGELQLRFLTTFRGNTQPNWFYVESRVPNAISFRAKRPTYLRVDITSAKQEVGIEVFLHEQIHVTIELTRRR